MTVQRRRGSAPRDGKGANERTSFLGSGSPGPKSPAAGQMLSRPSSSQRTAKIYCRYLTCFGALPWLSISKRSAGKQLRSFVCDTGQKPRNGKEPWQRQTKSMQLQTLQTFSFSLSDLTHAENTHGNNLKWENYEQESKINDVYNEIRCAKSHTK